eukprot:Opistho-2@48871
MRPDDNKYKDNARKRNQQNAKRRDAARSGGAASPAEAHAHARSAHATQNRRDMDVRKGTVGVHPRGGLGGGGKGEGSKNDADQDAKGGTDSASAAEANDADDAEDARTYFGRRAISSNWERYEKVEADSEDKPLDFRAAVQTAGHKERTSDDHFRFKDEKEWQARPLMLSDAPPSVLEFLSIDCDRIADALLAVPFHRRGGLPRAAFDGRVVAFYDDDAAFHARSIEAMEKIAPTAPLTLQSQNSTSAAATPAAVRDGPPRKKSDPTDVRANAPATPTHAREDTISAHDIDLDDLLGNGGPSTALLHAHDDLIADSAPPLETDVGSATPEMDDTCTPTAAAAAAAAPTPAPAHTKPPPSLDDWLDSMLD